MIRASICADKRHGRFPVRAGLLSVMVIWQMFLALPANGHGYMTYPKSRAGEQFKGDEKAWPIAGIKAGLRREPCIGLKFNKHFTELATGPVQLEFLFPDGANHVGFCQAYLFDPLKPGNKVQIGDSMDCARSAHPGPGKKGEDIPGHMTVTIPDTLPCDPSHCVLQWVWTATHVSHTDPQRYEHYDSCADVRIVEAHKASAKAVPLAKAPSSAARQPDNPSSQHYLERMIALSKVDGGLGNEDAIREAKRRIEELAPAKSSGSGGGRRAGADNERGIEFLRSGQAAEAMKAFEAAYEADPTSAEIINNLAYAHLRQNDPVAAERLLLLALSHEPGRANGWMNLGESYAGQGKRAAAVACFSLAYRFSRNRSVTRRFLENLAGNGSGEISKAAEQALQLRFIRTDGNS
jgi:Flp pilus assembly protein TadD